MRLYIKTQPNSSRNRIKKRAEVEYKVWLTAKPIKNEANKSLVRLLADYFSIPKDQVIIVAGKTSKDKIVDVFK